MVTHIGHPQTIHLSSKPCPLQCAQNIIHSPRRSDDKLGGFFASFTNMFIVNEVNEAWCCPLIRHSVQSSQKGGDAAVILRFDRRSVLQIGYYILFIH